MMAGDRVPAGDFYATYHGHTVSHLEKLHSLLRGTGPAGFIYLAGDSSLDNKHWFFTGSPRKQDQIKEPSVFVGKAVNGFEKALSPPLMAKDVAYWLNIECVDQVEKGKDRLCAINTAIEQSTLVQREEAASGLLAQDEFIRDHISEHDVLVVDVGGNDIALKPSAGVIINMGILLYLTPALLIRGGPITGWGLLYFIHMFKRRLEAYINKLVEKHKPRKVIPCMLYFLDETPGGSWADGVLRQLGYNDNPNKLQTVMRKVYAWGVSQIHIPDVEVSPLALYETLDGKDHSDYLRRVEPSVSGGQKMARAIAEKVFE